MSSFRRSTELLNDVTYKVLAWGPEGVGKSHLLFSAPDVAAIDFEHRAGHFRHSFEFLEVAPKTVREGIAAIAEIATGRIACKTVGVDSLTRPYETLIRRYSKSKSTDNGSYVETDWVSVNREFFAEIMDPLFSIADKNIVCTAKQAVRMAREGKNFRRDGVKMVGDEQRWLFYFDFVLHYSSRGCFKITKSMSPNLPVDTILYGDMDWPRLMRLISGEEKPDDVRPPDAHRLRGQRPAQPPPREAQPPQLADPAAAPASNAPSGVEALFVNIPTAECRRILALAKAKRVDDQRLSEIVATLTGSPTTPLLDTHVEPLVETLKAQEAA